MAIQFEDVGRAALADLDLQYNQVLTATIITRYCCEVYHELLHTKPDLQTVFDPIAGGITDLPDYITPDTATEFPDSLDGRWVAILAGVKARIIKQFLTTDAQVARFRIEDGAFDVEQGVTKPR